MKNLWLLGLLMALPGCDDDGKNIAGMYVVTSQVRDVMGCGAGTPTAMPPTHMMAEKGDIFGQTYYTIKGCTSSDPMTCSSTLGSLLGEQISDGWSGYLSFSTTSNDRCTLVHQRVNATLIDGVLTVDRTDHKLERMPADPCDAKEATEKGTEMPCTAHTVTIGMESPQ